MHDETSRKQAGASRNGGDEGGRGGLGPLRSLKKEAVAMNQADKADTLRARFLGWRQRLLAHEKTGTPQVISNYHACRLCGYSVLLSLIIATQTLVCYQPVLDVITVCRRAVLVSPISSHLASFNPP
ncbi:MAG: hypothetical protein Q9192_005814 [Flavoplaca navasiana]